MKIRLVLLPVLAMFVTASFAQTKRIAHHSHSGSDAEFATGGSDNFGLSPQMERQMDSARKEKQRLDDSIRVSHYRDSLKKAKAKKK